MLNQNKTKTAHIKTTAHAHRLVKLIAAATGESMMAVAERLAADEWERLQGDDAPPANIPPWEEFINEYAERAKEQ